MSMSRAAPFASGKGSSSWADDDDVDIPVAKPEQHEQEPIDEERHDDDYPEHQDDRRDDRGYREERGGYREDRGGYREDRRDRGDDRRGGYERPKNPVPDQPPFKVYVGNLPFRMNEDDLADFFGSKDITDIRIPRNEEDRPKGFAYVEFETRDALVAALELDGCTAGGRAIRVDVAIERERKPRQRDNFFERRSDRPGRDNWERDSRGPREPREPLEARAPRERHRLELLPRTTSSEQDAAPSKKASIFGEAKPRDEAAYQERKERERKERERKAAEAKEAKAKAQQAKEERAKQGDVSDKAKTTAAPRSGRAGAGARTHDDRSAPRDRAPPAERTHAKREAKPPQTAPKAKSATKVQNVFDLLNDDDDSDSD